MDAWTHGLLRCWTRCAQNSSTWRQVYRRFIRNGLISRHNGTNTIERARREERDQLMEPGRARQPVHLEERGIAGDDHRRHAHNWIAGRGAARKMRRRPSLAFDFFRLELARGDGGRQQRRQKRCVRKRQQNSLKRRVQVYQNISPTTNHQMTTHDTDFTFTHHLQNKYSFTHIKARAGDQVYS